MADQFNKIGFIGLGIMGKPMALNLIKAGRKLAVYDIRPEPVEELVKKGAERCLSPKHVAGISDLVITMLPDSPDVKEVVLGNDGVLKGIRPGTIIVDMSSIAPAVSIEISKKVKEKGVEMIDAPVSGGEPKAIEGTLSIMAGGSLNTFEKVEGVLKAMGSSVVRVGEIGSGNITKLANQIIVALNIAAMSEAMVLAEKAGVDAESVFNAIRGGLAGSTVLNAKMPMILDANFKPGFRIGLHIKDLKNALETANELGVAVPLTKGIMEIMQTLKVDGKASDDHGGVIRFYEKQAGVEVRKKPKE
jgi:2-hydroxy-3-oxopropionate reductase